MYGSKKTLLSSKQKTLPESLKKKIVAAKAKKKKKVMKNASQT